MTKIDYMQKPQRPFGVTLAILTTVLIFTILPLLEVILLVSVNNLMVFDEVGRSGMNVIGIENIKGQMILQSALAIGFLVIAILAWIGRPKFIRVIFSGIVGLIGIVTIAVQILPRLADAPTVMDSSRAFNQPVLIFYLVMTILITLYVVWYLNRWAARAFYRGYYLPEDIEEMKRIEAEFVPSAYNKSKGESIS